MKKLFIVILTLTLLTGVSLAAAACSSESVTIVYVATDGGSISGPATQTIKAGKDAVEVTAAPLDGYIFSKWSDGDTNPVRQDKNIRESSTLIASFNKIGSMVTLSVNYAATVGGQIKGEIIQYVHYGQNATTVEAVHDQGYKFEKWSDGVATSQRTDENIKAGFSVTAIFSVFQPVYVQINYEKGEGGDIEGEPIQYVLYGQGTSPVKAVANDGYTFTRWSDGRVDAVRTDENIDASFTVMAIFTKIQPVYVQVTYIAGTGGHFKDALTQDVTQAVLYGQAALSVEAVADKGYTFSRWSDGRVESVRIDEDIKEEITVTAIFCKSTPMYIQVKYMAGSGGYIRGEDIQYPDYGESTETVEAVADNGYAFVKWSDGLRVAERADENITEELTLTAIFSKADPPYVQVKYVADLGGIIVGEDEQEVIYGQDALTVEAVAADGYEFVKWSDGSRLSQRTDENITEEITVYAIFSKIHSISLQIMYIAGTGGSINGIAIQEVTYGQDASTVEAVANNDYVFIEWSDGMRLPQRTDMGIDAGFTVYAIFAKIQIVYVQVTYAAGTGGHIGGEPVQKVIYGQDTTTVEAIPSEGYAFTKWSDGIVTSERNDTDITAEFTVYAIFTKIHSVYVQVKYIAGTGGHFKNAVSQDVIQNVEYGQDAAAVEALADEGYVFVGWSDGVRSAERTDIKVEAEFTVYAIFEKIT